MKAITKAIKSIGPVNDEKINIWIEATTKAEYAVKKHSGIEKPIVLDLGCGNPYWASMIFSSKGYQVIGVDIEDVRHNCSYCKIAATQGIKYALKRYFRDRIGSQDLYRKLNQKFDNSLDPKKLDIRLIDAHGMPFEDNTFDLIFSHAVLEHVEKIPVALTEMKRVLKQNGIMYHTIHLFPSLTGGHMGPSISAGGYVPDSERWQHLNGGPIFTGLNKLKLDDYQGAFEELFEILEWHENQAYSDLLTQEIEMQFRDLFTKRDLITETVSVVVRKTQ